MRRIHLSLLAVVVAFGFMAPVARAAGELDEFIDHDAHKPQAAQKVTAAKTAAPRVAAAPARSGRQVASKAKGKPGKAKPRTNAARRRR